MRILLFPVALLLLLVATSGCLISGGDDDVPTGDWRLSVTTDSLVYHLVDLNGSDARTSVVATLSNTGSDAVMVHALESTRPIGHVLPLDHTMQESGLMQPGYYAPERSYVLESGATYIDTLRVDFTREREGYVSATGRYLVEYGFAGWSEGREEWTWEDVVLEQQVYEAESNVFELRAPW